MHLLIVGLNHNTAPLAVRETVAVNEHGLPAALGRLLAECDVEEACILSTCNRTEIYCAFDGDNDRGEDVIIAYLETLHGLDRRDLEGHIYSYRNGAAVAHLMSVTSGLDSMMLGEYQIQNQVKNAYAAARAANAAGPVLNSLFQCALATGKKVRTETEITRGAFTVGSAAVDLATRIFGDTLSGQTVLILGAGKMSDVTARHLQARGAPTIFVANRTYERAEQLAADIGGSATARRFDDLPQLLVSSDIVICSTAAPHPIVTRDLISQALRKRHNRALFLIDIAVPRDIEPSVGDLDNVYLFNIDDLHLVVDQARHERAAEAIKAQAIIDKQVAEFLTWRKTLETAPMIVSVRQHLEALRLDEMAKLRAKLPHLSDRDLKACESAMQSMSGKISHTAITAIKKSAMDDAGESLTRLEAIRDAFGLDSSGPEKGGR